MKMRLIKKNGFTLLELMVSLAILGIVVGAIFAIFGHQEESYVKGKRMKEIQETAQPAIEIIKKDLIMAGWAVDPKMAFFIQDGGTGTSDSIYINDWTFVDEDELLDEIYGYTTISSGSGTSAISIQDGDIDTSANGKNGICPKPSDIRHCNDDNNPDEFAAGIYQFIITDGTTTTGPSIGRITGYDGSTITLDRSVQGTKVAPAIYYGVNSSRSSLQRSSISTPGGATEGALLANNIVDMQVAYRDNNGIWYCDSSTSTCPMNPFDPTSIDLIRVSLVVRTSGKTSFGFKSQNPWPLENRNSGPFDNDFIYRTYTVYIKPRNNIN